VPVHCKNISAIMKINIYAALGTSVRGHRKRLNWSQEELGDRAGLHPSYIGQIERGTKKISLATLAKVSAALMVKAADLLEEKAPKVRTTTWETRIIGIIRNKSSGIQKRTYLTIRAALAPERKRK